MGQTSTDDDGTGSGQETVSGSGDDTSGARSTSGETGEGTTGTGEQADITVYDIQQGKQSLDAIVDVQDVIVTGVGENGFFVQEPPGGMYSGIWVFTGIAGAPPLPALGDIVSISGVYEEFFGLSEVNINEGTLIVTNSPGPSNVPALEDLTLADISEPWEGVLVRLTDSTFEVDEVGVAAQSDFRVGEPKGATIWVDDDLYDVVGSGDFGGFGVGASFTNIQGPVGYAFDEYRIVPRTMTDLGGYQP